MKKPVIGINVLLESHTNNDNNLVRDYYAVQNKYVDAVYEAGAIPLLIPPLENRDILEFYLDEADAMVFIGGPDYPPQWYHESRHPKTQLSRQRADCDLFLMRGTLERKLPLMAICAGHQLLNIACGGKLIQHMDNAEMHTGGKNHKSKIITEGIFSSLCGLDAGDELTLNSYHHQCIDPDYVGQHLRVTARAFDNSIEVVEGTGKNHFVLGVQFHIERQDNLRQTFFAKLVEEA